MLLLNQDSHPSTYTPSHCFWFCSLSLLQKTCFFFGHQSNLLFCKYGLLSKFHNFLVSKYNSMQSILVRCTVLHMLGFKTTEWVRRLCKSKSNFLRYHDLQPHSSTLATWSSYTPFGIISLFNGTAFHSSFKSMGACYIRSPWSLEQKPLLLCGSSVCLSCRFLHGTDCAILSLF